MKKLPLICLLILICGFSPLYAQMKIDTTTKNAEMASSKDWERYDKRYEKVLKKEAKEKRHYEAQLKKLNRMTANYERHQDRFLSQKEKGKLSDKQIKKNERSLKKQLRQIERLEKLVYKQQKKIDSEKADETKTS